MAKTAGSRTSQTERPNGTPKWTVMVFMGAATIEGTVPLDDAARADLAEMALVGSGDCREADDPDAKVQGTLNIFVQIHQGRAKMPRRARVTEGMSNDIDSLGEVPAELRETAQGVALRGFIRWAIEQAGHDPENDNHYSLLVLWGHAYDFAFGRETTARGVIDALDFHELSVLLRTLRDDLDAPGAKLDILGFDACDVATVEIASQLEPFARYLLGSEIGIPIPGWPYDRILDRVRRPKGDLMGPAEFGTYIVRRFCESYRASMRPVSLTLLNLLRAPNVFFAAEALTLAMARVIDDPAMRRRIAYLFADSQTAKDRPFVDVADLCLNLMRNSGDALIAEAAADLGDILITPRPPLVGESNAASQRPFVVEHGRNAGQTARLNGVSLYAPHLVLERDFNSVHDLYREFVFARETRWSDLVHVLARSR